MDVHQHITHLAVLQYGGVQAKTESDLPYKDLEICSQEARWRRRCQGLIVHRLDLLEPMEFAIVVGE